MSLLCIPLLVFMYSTQSADDSDIFRSDDLRQVIYSFCNGMDDENCLHLRLVSSDWNQLVQDESLKQISRLTELIQSFNQARRFNITREIAEIMQNKNARFIAFIFANHLPIHFNSTILPLLENLNYDTRFRLFTLRTRLLYYYKRNDLLLQRIAFYNRVILCDDAAFTFGAFDNHSNGTDTTAINKAIHQKLAVIYNPDIQNDSMQPPSSYSVRRILFNYASSCIYAECKKSTARRKRNRDISRSTDFRVQYSRMIKNPWSDPFENSTKV